MLYISYIDLSPGIDNPLIDGTHHVLVRRLRESFEGWTNFRHRYPDYDLGFIVSTRLGSSVVEVKGPTVSKRSKVVDFAIHLPAEIDRFSPDDPKDVCIYLSWILDGVGEALQQLVDWAEIQTLKRNCADDLHIRCT
jgi:hypothetical protein